MLNWLKGLFSDNGVVVPKVESNTNTQPIAAKENIKKIYDVSEPVISFVELVKRDRKRFEFEKHVLEGSLGMSYHLMLKDNLNGKVFLLNCNTLATYNSEGLNFKLSTTWPNLVVKFGSDQEVTEDLSFLTEDELDFIKRELVQVYWKRLERIEHIQQLRRSRQFEKMRKAKLDAQREAFKQEYCKES
jgi:hypothetical protein